MRALSPGCHMQQHTSLRRQSIRLRLNPSLLHPGQRLWISGVSSTYPQSSLCTQCILPSCHIVTDMSTTPTSPVPPSETAVEADRERQTRHHRAYGVHAVSGLRHVAGVLAESATRLRCVAVRCTQRSICPQPCWGPAAHEP